MKPVTCTKPEDAIEYEYQLTQVSVYKRDLRRVRKPKGWWDPR